MPDDRRTPFPSVGGNAQNCLIRIDGVNHDQFIFDTNDLSTVRGGGLILLNAVDKATQGLGPTCEVISSGASSGLFRVSGASPASWVQKLRDQLNKGEEAHASFVVAAVAESGDFPADNETLIALNRFEQMTMPSLQVPGLGSAALGVCEVDRIRPAAEERKVKGESKKLSASVELRRGYGKKEKQRLYTATLKKSFKPQQPSPHDALANTIETAGLRFADEFSDIADDETKRALHGKIAVFYADGNSFGKHQRAAQTPKALREWDQHIKALRRDLLAHLIKPFFREAEERKGKIRFETLLWGGDEMLFVVPAREGVPLVERFLDATKDWQYPPGSGKPLTHAMGLVLCHSNTPIARVRQLAKTLGDQAKTDAGRGVNSLHTVVLESFDHVGASWPDYLARTYRGCSKSEQRVIRGDAWSQSLSGWAQLKKDLPEGRLHNYLQAVLQPSGVSDQDQNRLTHDLPADLKTLLERKAADPTWFFLAAELWDYLPAPESTANTRPDNTDEGDRA
jgi:hypothetical protein